MKNLSRTIALVLMTVLLALVAAACGASNASSPVDAAAGPSSGEPSGAAGAATPSSSPSAAGTPSETPEDAGTLTVYLNDFDEIIADMFTEATGYKINLVTGNGAELMSRIEAERGNPHWDVIWADMMPSIEGLREDGQLMEWTPANVSNVKASFQPYISPHHAYFPTGAHAAGIIVYNEDALQGDLAPTAWADFTKPEYEGLIGMADPAVAAPAYPFVAQFFNRMGMEDGKDYFSSLMKNGLRVYPKNPQVVQALTSGEIKIAALQESNAYAMLRDGAKLGLVWPEEGAPASVRVAAIQSKTANPNAAKAFVEFLLDPKTQQALIDRGEESYFEPSATGVDPKPDRDPNAKLVAAEASWASEHEAEIKQWFADQAVR